MASEIYDFPSSPTYDTEIIKLKRSDPADAETVFNPLFQRLITNTHYVKLMAEQCGAKLLELTIPQSAWENGSDETGGAYEYYANVTADVTTDIIVASGAVAVADEDTARDCGLADVCRTLDGEVRFYAQSAATADIAITLVLLNAVVTLGGSSGGSTGSTGDYELPIATRYVLGGVKVGDGLNVSSTGVLSVDTTSVTDDIAATDEDVDAMLDEVFS